VIQDAAEIAEIVEEAERRKEEKEFLRRGLESEILG